MAITARNLNKGVERANKIYIHTKYSSDGRTTEGFWVDYNPDDLSYGEHLFELTLNASEMVEYYIVYDGKGEKIENTNKEYYPKRH